MPIISLQITQELSEQIDKVQTELGLASRSEALREAILSFLRQNQEKTEPSGHKIANIILHHEVREDILNQFSEIMEEYSNIVKGIYQYNLKSRIIKSILVAGEGGEINDLFKKLTAAKNFTPTISYILLPDLKVEEIQEELQKETK